MAELASTITPILVIARRPDAARINPLHKSRCFALGIEPLADKLARQRA
jgi:hypothetical protein